MDTPYDLYMIGDRVRDEISPDLFITWNRHSKKHDIWYKGTYVMQNPYPQLDARLLTHLRSIDRNSNTYDPFKTVDEANHNRERAWQKTTDEIVETAAKECLRGAQHDLGVA